MWEICLIWIASYIEIIVHVNGIILSLTLQYAQNMGPPFAISFLPRMKVLHLLIGIILLLLQMVHSSLRVTFFVVFDFFLKMGLVWPPKPFCLASYLLLPWATREALPVLYWDTLWGVCFLHFWQWVFLTLGVCTYFHYIINIYSRYYHFFLVKNIY